MNKHLEVCPETGLIIGYHYSTREINEGSVVYSKQDQSTTYQRFWKIYKSIADELGIFYPEKFGYAAPNRNYGASRGFPNCYEVRSEKNLVCVGNYHHSLYITMSIGLQNGDFKKIRSLPERIAAQDKYIIGEARKYFTELTDVDSLEVISENWIVQKRVV